MPTIHAYISDEAYEILKRMKGHLTWSQFFEQLAKKLASDGSKHTPVSQVKQSSNLEVRVSRLEEQIKALSRQVNDLWAKLSAKLEREPEKVEGEKLATEKQIKYIWTLVKRLGVTVSDIEKEFGVNLANVSLGKEQLPRDVATEIINWLKEKEKASSSKTETNK